MSRLGITLVVCMCGFSFPFFFFQAEDGIRDHCVTGVQTCALPILQRQAVTLRGRSRELMDSYRRLEERSEERRVGKGVDLGGRRIIKKKKGTKRNTPAALSQQANTRVRHISE